MKKRINSKSLKSFSCWNFGFLALCLILIQSCGSQPASDEKKGLADYYKDYFPIGAAVSPRELIPPISNLVIEQFNSLTPDNAMKMGPIHPREDTFRWKAADEIVDFAMAHGMKVRGHALVWHEQTPDWLFTDKGKQVEKEVLLSRMENHIDSVVSRYKGIIYCWDVVNEAVADDSTFVYRASPWYNICGEEFIEKAFIRAHEVDPDAKLFYNDYNLNRPEKRERAYQLLKNLVDKGIPVTGVGMQAHWSLNEPSKKDLEDAIARFSSLGLEVQFTELDISVYPWEKERRSLRPGESDSLYVSIEQKQREQYKMIFEVFRKHKDVISGVTFWGTTDGRSWLNYYPVPGRRNYPLLFDRNMKPKAVFQDVTDF